MIYTWQIPLWNQLWQLKSRSHHALLLYGRPGIGKYDFALHLAQALLCKNPKVEGFACGICQSCSWFAQGHHPDFKHIKPEDGEEEGKTAKKSQQIVVGQIRTLAADLELSGHEQGGLRIVVIHPAEAMNAIAGNALLKILEEPPSDVLFLLVSHRPQRMLPTVLSRCQKLEMPSPDAPIALQWLRDNGIEHPEEALSYAAGAPLAARDYMHDNPIPRILAQGSLINTESSSSTLNKYGMTEALRAIQKWLYDLTLQRLCNETRYHLKHDALQSLAIRVDLSRLLDFQRKVDMAYQSATHPLNNELQLENLLIQYTHLFDS